MKPLVFTTCFVGLIVFPAPAVGAADPTPAEYFEKHVRPLLLDHCLKCHGDKKPKGGLSLTSRAAVLRGGDSGPAVVPGEPNKSPLIQAVRYLEKPQMPPKKKLDDRDVAVLVRWVKIGAPWPDAVAKTVAAGKPFTITEQQRRFWSFQPVRPVAPPTVAGADWARTPIDRFLLAGLQGKGLRPAQPADRRTLIRRAAFDLLGLPPTPEEVDAFVNDSAADAWEKVIDRLLASPAYGERWGRHWLDLVRYTDSFDARGIGGAMDCADAWRYRDWVVRALNADLPYDRFVREQIAGDVLSGATDRDGVVATTMLAIGNWGGGDADKEKLLTDIADDQVDVVTRTFLGLTVACARCHDHKFDPISTADYYGLAGIFFSTHILPNVGPKTNGPPMLRIPLTSAADRERRKKHVDRLARAKLALQASRKKAYADHARAMLPHTARHLLAAYDRENPPPRPAQGAANLLPYAVERWAAYLHLGDYKPLTRLVRNAAGKSGVHAWRNEPDCPNVLINTTAKQQTISTLRLPPRSVAVHPGPNNGVVVAWRSPVAGTVKVVGRVRDADATCGDGIAWIVDHHSARGVHEVASGAIANGGEQQLAAGKEGKRLDSLAVQPGDRIELLVLPRANHSCDTTTVELAVRLADGSKSWDLTKDVLADPFLENKGGATVWQFLDMADSRRGARLAGNRGDWLRVVREARAGKADRKRLEQAAEAFARTFTLTDERSPFWITNPADEGRLPLTVRTELAKEAAEVSALERTAFSEEFANGAQEGGVPGSPHAGVHDVRIHHRGRYDRLGDLVPRRFPEILAGAKQPAITRGSGRVELANWLTQAKNPLTARVMVNRIWQHHFGRALVNTPSNFGWLGERPTHPELLDWLAAEFVRSGWSIKHMHRLMMRSSAYRQSSEAEAATIDADPDNRLYGRMARRRLEAEAVRDSLLAAAGRLDRRQGGPSHRNFTDPRRTLYLTTVRSDRSGFGPLFDSADNTAPVDKRTVSTVAPQALFLLNNPFVKEQTAAFTRRVMESAKDDRQRIKNAYPLLYARPPIAAEVAVGERYLAHGGPTAWLDYCQVLLCGNEFVYVD